MNEYELTLTIGRVKEEHAAWTARVLRTLSEVFGADGSDVSVVLSAERDRDGYERIYELLPEAVNTL